MKKRAVTHFFRSIFDIREDTMSHDELHEMMKENTIIHGSNMWILIMAIFIASIGLNVNSTAVIIGAMLVSPLMSGILTMGYSLATSDLTMLKRAFTRFCTQVFISLITSTIYFAISPLQVPTSEMIARTSPTLWDVLIALFGGIAGMIGNTRQKKSNVIPGVAIATALMPPLCTAGYGIASMQLRFLLGAFYLFAINTLFIMLSAALVTKLLKVPEHENRDEKKQKQIKSLITVITVITVLPSIVIGAYTVYNSVISMNINNYIEREFAFPNTQVVRSDSDIMGKTLSVSLVGETISDDTVNRLEQALSLYGLEEFQLRVTQNIVINSEEDDKVTIAVQELTIQELQRQLEEQQEAIDEMESNIASRIDCKKLASDAGSIFRSLTNCRCGVMTDGDEEYILLSANSSKKFSAAEKQTIKNWLMTETGLSKAEVIITE